MRYFSILDGTSLSDVANAEGGYNYYLYTRAGGSAVIMRENTAETEYRFALLGNPGFTESTVTTFWTNRATQTFIRVSELKAL
jgi:hypothetical protein